MREIDGSRQWKIRVPDGYEIGVWAERAEEITLPGGDVVVRLYKPTKHIEGRLVVPEPPKIAAPEPDPPQLVVVPEPESEPESTEVVVVDDEIIPVITIQDMSFDEILELIGNSRLRKIGEEIVVCDEYLR